MKYYENMPEEEAYKQVKTVQDIAKRMNGKMTGAIMRNRDKDDSVTIKLTYEEVLVFLRLTGHAFEIHGYREKQFKPENGEYTKEQAIAELRRRICCEGAGGGVYHFCDDSCLYGEAKCPIAIAIKALDEEVIRQQTGEEAEKEAINKIVQKAYAEAKRRKEAQA